MNAGFVFSSLGLAVWLAGGIGLVAASQEIPAGAGSLDPQFSASMGVYPPWNNGPGVRRLIVQPDGRVLISGGFRRVQGIPRNGLARFEAGGSLDRGFVPAIVAIQDLALQADGKLLVAGGVAVVNGEALRPGLARLNPDGSWDPSFNASPGTDATAVAVLAGGQIAAGITLAGTDTMPARHTVALFDSLGQQPAGWWTFFESPAPIFSLVASPDTRRLIINGSVELALDAPGQNYRYLTNALPPGFVASCAVFQPDGKLLVGGQIPNAPNIEITHAIRQPVVRLNQDGSLDVTFSTNLTIGVPPMESGSGYLQVYSLVLQPDGKVLMGGFFTQVSGERRTLVARLESDGRLDPDFTPDIAVNPGWDVDAMQTVSAMALTPDGGLLIGGVLNYVNGLECHSLARLHTTTESSGGILAFAQPQNYAWETNGTLEVTVRRHGQTQQTVSVFYDSGDIRDISQAPNPVRGHLVFAPGELAKTIVIPLRDNQVIENSQSFYLTLRHPGGGAVLTTDPQTKITIYDDDSAGIPGSVDLAYAPDFGLPGIVYSVKIMALEPDGSLLAQVIWATNSWRYSTLLVRLNPNGQRDPAFLVTTDQSIEAVFADSSSGRILIAGYFTTVNGQPRTGLARVDHQGTLDATFDVSLDGWVSVLQAPLGGTMVIAGGFSQVNGVTRHRLARLNMNGSVDLQFDTSGLTMDYWFTGVNSLPDGKTLVCGYFNQINGLNRPKMARLNADGSVDLPFNLTAFHDGASINSFLRQPDGSLVVVGNFTTIDGQSGSVARLNPDGSLDMTFAAANQFYDANAPLLLQPNGKIVVAGKWRLNPDGTLDRSFFTAAATAAVNAAVRLSNGDLFVSGTFQTFNEFPRPHLVRLHGGDTPAPNFFEFVNASLYVGEDAGSAHLLVRRVGDTQTTASVHYATADVTARDGDDYTGVTGTLVFAPGVTEQPIVISILDNLVPQDNRYFTVHLNEASPGVRLSAEFTASVGIIEDDAGVRFRHAEYWIPEDWTGTTNATGWLVADLVRTGSAENALTVQCRLDGGTAQSGRDYVATNLTLEFGAYQTELSVYVPLLRNDAALEDRTLNMTLNNPVPPTPLAEPSIAQLTITARHPPARFMIPALRQAADGSLRLYCDIIPGQFLHVQTSTNLVDWMDAGYVHRSETDGPALFEDRDAWQYPLRFYRTIQFIDD